MPALFRKGLIVVFILAAAACSSEEERAPVATSTAAPSSPAASTDKPAASSPATSAGASASFPTNTEVAAPHLRTGDYDPSLTHSSPLLSIFGLLLLIGLVWLIQRNGDKMVRHAAPPYRGPSGSSGSGGGSGSASVAKTPTPAAPVASGGTTPSGAATGASAAASTRPATIASAAGATAPPRAATTDADSTKRAGLVSRLPIDDSDTSAGSPKGIAAAAAAAAAAASDLESSTPDSSTTNRATDGGQSGPSRASEASASNADGTTSDDLTRVEGVGPKIAGLLQADGITTFRKLADASHADLKRILEAAGPRYTMHDPLSWPEQAALAASGDWTALKALQDKLDGGRRAT